MGSDREARALGAGDVLEVGKKKVRLRPIVVRHLCELEREALRAYKRQYIESFADSLKLVNGQDSAKVLQAKMEEVASWDVSSLPRKHVYDASSIPVTPKLLDWIESEFDLRPEQEFSARAILSMALDTKIIGPQEVKKLSGTVPRRGSVRYDQWWVTASAEGMARFVYLALEGSGKNKLSYEDVCEWDYPKLIEASRIVEKLTAVQMGNG